MGLKKTGSICLMDLFEGSGKKGWCNIVFVEHCKLLILGEGKNQKA